MVRGVEKFKEYFSNFHNQYVLIEGSIPLLVVRLVILFWEI